MFASASVAAPIAVGSVMPKQWGVCCNYAGDNAIRAGAKAVLLWWSGGNGGERNEMVVHGRGGRKIKKWLRLDKTWNWRPVFIDESKCMCGGFDLGRHATKEEASEWCATVNERLDREFSIEWRMRGQTETLHGGAKPEATYIFASGSADCIPSEHGDRRFSVYHFNEDDNKCSTTS